MFGNYFSTQMGGFFLRRYIRECNLSHTIYSFTPADRANESEIAAWQR